MGTEILEMAQLERMSFAQLHAIVVSADLATAMRVLDHARQCLAANRIAPDAGVPDEVRTAMRRLSNLELAAVARIRTFDARPVETESVDDFVRGSVRGISRGDVFSTKHEDGCVALEPANSHGSFLAIDSEGVEAHFHIAMVEEIISPATPPTGPASNIYSEGVRLIDVAKMHRARMIRELGDPDSRVQRGNAATFASVEANISTRIDCLRAFGFVEHARLLEDAAGVLAEPLVKLPQGELDSRD